MRYFTRGWFVQWAGWWGYVLPCINGSPIMWQLFLNCNLKYLLIPKFKFKKQSSSWGHFLLPGIVLFFSEMCTTTEERKTSSMIFSSMGRWGALGGGGEGTNYLSKPWSRGI